MSVGVCVKRPRTHKVSFASMIFSNTSTRIDGSESSVASSGRAALPRQMKMSGCYWHWSVYLTVRYPLCRGSTALSFVSPTRVPVRSLPKLLWPYVFVLCVLVGVCAVQHIYSPYAARQHTTCSIRYKNKK